MNIKVKSYIDILGNPFILLLLTIIGYTLYYCYNRGYYSRFGGIPFYFIDFSLQSVISVFLIILCFLIIIIPIAAFEDSLFNKIKFKAFNISAKFIPYVLFLNITLIILFSMFSAYGIGIAFANITNNII